MRSGGFATEGEGVLGIPAAVLAAAAVIYLTAAPSTALDELPMLGALMAIAAIAYSAKVWLEDDGADDSGGTTFDATVVVALVALYVAGPGAAIAVWLVPDVLHRCVFRRTPVFTRGLVFNLASFAVAVTAAGALLAAVPTGSPAGELAMLCLAGLVMIAINFGASPYLYGLLYETPAERRALLAELVRLAPSILVMMFAGAVTAALVDPVGLAALLVLSVALTLQEVRWQSIDVGAFVSPAPAPTRDDRFQETSHILEALTGQLDALVKASAPGRPLGDDADADCAEALIALRRLSNRRDLPDFAYRGADATIEILELVAGPRLLRPLPHPPELPPSPSPDP